MTGGAPSVAVFLRGKRIGETPFTGILPVGTHAITLKKQGTEIDYNDRTITVTIRENQITTVPQ